MCGEGIAHRARVPVLVAIGFAVAASTAATGAAFRAQSAPADTLREALERSLASGDSGAMAEALNALGLRFWNEARFDSAEAYLERARELWVALDDSAGMGRVYNNLGVTYYQWGHLASALDVYLRSLAVRRASGDRRGAALVLTNIARTYRDWHLYERSRAALDEAVAESDASGDAFVRGYSRHNRGLLLLELGDGAGAREAFEESLDAYQKGAAALTPAQVSDGVGMNRVGLGRVLLLTGDAGGAIRILEGVLGPSGARAQSARQAESLVALARAYLATGATSEAIATLERTLTLSRESGQRIRALDALVAMVDVYLARGDTRAALTHARLQIALRDSVGVERGAHEAAAIEGRIAAEREADENRRLREERRAREAVIARQRLGFVLGGALLVVSAAFVLTLVRHNREGRERERMLASANEALDRTNQELRVALSEVRTLEGLIPICARCKKVRDDRGFWESVESYVASRSSAHFTHGICNECGPLVYGEDWEPAGTGAEEPARPEPTS